MRTPLILGLLAAANGFITPPDQYIFANPPEALSNARIPTSYESAVMGRRILALTKLATLATVFPGTHANGDLPEAQERRPGGLDGVPIGMMDYIADCEGAGNPTILAINIATSFKNVRAGSNISVSLHWTPPYPPSKRISLSSFFSFSSASPRDTVPFSAANLPRFSLLGTLEPIVADPVAKVKLASCFTKTHPDAKYWLPGNHIHESEWVRLVVKQIYWVGGFGDRAYIGWIPVEEWNSVTEEEWRSIELPGERKGWHEWALADWAGGDL